MKGNTLINIVGPTATGKTSLAISVATHFKTEIISSDSRQFYKEMKIGTAVPSEEELAAARHHFIRHLSIEDAYNVGMFERDALQLLETLFLKHEVVVMAGGSGLYSNAVVQGLDEFPEVPPIVRKELNERLQQEGIASLQSQLKILDPGYYEQADIENPHRIMRALEICLATGKPFSTFLNKPRPKRPFNSINIGLTADRKVIYDRIDQRVDIMVANGLIEEAQALHPKKHLNALQTVGYRELFNYFEGEWALDFAISEIKKNTRRFAKRQLTWYRKDESIRWFEHETAHQQIVEEISSLIEKKEA